MRATTFSIPGSALITIRDFARATDGTIALSGSAADAGGRAASFIASISTDGQNARVVRTGAYRPFRIAFDPDGTIWTVGYEELVPLPANAKTMSETLDPRASVFRRFDRTGKQIGALVPQSEIKYPVSLTSVTSVFGVVGSRIIWYSAPEGQYIELSRDGTVTNITELALPNGGRENGFGLTEAGDLFLSSIGRRDWVLYKLDPAAHAWISITQGPIGTVSRSNPPIVLYGADANLLVAGTDAIKLQFFNAGTN